MFEVAQKGTDMILFPTAGLISLLTKFFNMWLPDPEDRAEKDASSNQLMGSYKFDLYFDDLSLKAVITGEISPAPCCKSQVCWTKFSSTNGIPPF